MVQFWEDRALFTAFVGESRHERIYHWKNDAGQRLDRWLAKTIPLLPAPLAQKYIRLKRVKVNGKGSKRDIRLNVGDVLQLYINDEFFDRPTPENAFCPCTSRS